MSLKTSDISYVLISHECNFWVLGSLRCLLRSLDISGIEGAKCYVIHVGKSKEQIDHFEKTSNSIRSNQQVINVIAYENCFPLFDNVSFAEDPYVFVGHGFIVCWLIKYYLDLGKYIFVDSDAFVKDNFIENLHESFLSKCEGQYWVLPDQSPSQKSLTMPGFYVDSALLKPLLDKIPDMLWLTFWKGGFGNGFKCEKLLPKDEKEIIDIDGYKEISRIVLWDEPYFMDTLYNILVHLLYRFPETRNAISYYDLSDLEHMGSFYKLNFLTSEQIAYYSDRFLDIFLPQLDEKDWEADKRTFTYRSLMDMLRRAGRQKRYLEQTGQYNDFEMKTLEEANFIRNYDWSIRLSIKDISLLRTDKDIITWKNSSEEPVSYLAIRYADYLRFCLQFGYYSNKEKKWVCPFSKTFDTCKVSTLTINCRRRGSLLELTLLEDNNDKPIDSWSVNYEPIDNISKCYVQSNGAYSAEFYPFTYDAIE